MDVSPLAILERAELAARERRLTASAEADRITAAAEERAATIDAAVPDRIQAALDRLRDQHERAADAEIRVLEGLLRTPDGTDPRTVQDDAFEAAVDLVVRAVLGEGSDRDRWRVQHAPAALTAPGGSD